MATVIPDGSLLRVRDVVAAIDRVLADEMTPSDVTEWADLLEMHEGVRYQPRREADLADVLFRLATPEINGGVTHAVLVEVRQFLTTKL